MPKNSLNAIVSYMQARIGSERSPSILIIEWLKSAIRHRATTGSIQAFAPLDARMAKDRPFTDLLNDLISHLIAEQKIEELDTRTLLSIALADSLELLRDENRTWADQRNSENEIDFDDASLLSATVLAVFNVLQELDSGKAMRFANDLLTDNETSYGFFSVGTDPFAMRLFAAVKSRHANSEVRSSFFITLFEWAAKNTTIPQVIARFPELLILRLEAAYGENIDQQMFEVLQSSFISRGDENLQPVEVIDMCINDQIEDFGAPEVLDEYATRLTDLTATYIGRFIREMPMTEKRIWLESETMRKAFWGPLNRPPIPEYHADETVYEDGSALQSIMAKVA